MLEILTCMMAPGRHHARRTLATGASAVECRASRGAQNDISKVMRKLLWFFAPLIGWTFAHMSFAIPIKRLRETNTLMAFYHPKPSYPFHVLLVPKKAVASLREFDPADTTFLADLYSIVQSLVNEFHLSAYRLIVNGGEYQDFPQLHFHLISDVQRSNV